MLGVERIIQTGIPDIASVYRYRFLPNMNESIKSLVYDMMSILTSNLSGTVVTIKL